MTDSENHVLATLGQAVLQLIRAAPATLSIEERSALIRSVENVLRLLGGRAAR